MSRDDVLKELRERRVRREADDREAEIHGITRCENLADAWRDAQGEATAAYELWSEDKGADGYAVYRAAQDRADEAQDALWQQHILTDCAPGYERWVIQ
jgi:hypothetical protein